MFSSFFVFLIVVLKKHRDLSGFGMNNQERSRYIRGWRGSAEVDGRGESRWGPPLGWSGLQNHRGYGDFHGHGGTPSHHLFLDGIFRNKNQPVIGVPPFTETPRYRDPGLYEID